MSSNKVAYICSSAHAGSTILELLLSGHPEMSGLGEVLYLNADLERQVPCACGMALYECNSWHGALRQIEKTRMVDFSSSPFEFWLGEINYKNVDWYNSYRKVRHHFRNALEFLIYRLGLGGAAHYFPYVGKSVRNVSLLYEALGNLRDVSFLIDSSKRYLHGLNLYLQNKGSFKFVYLIRDGRSVMASHLKRGHSLKNSVYNWKNFYDRSQSLFSKYVSDEDVIFIKFEDLCTKPESTLEKICVFLGVSTTYTYDMLNMDRDELHTVGGNWTKFDNQIKLRPPRDWSELLNKDQENYFNEHALTTNVKLGYG
ncbi:MAG: sulfotransferase [Desulfovibrionaceae bacterium]|nr:sulfotransferase [Desulfovibrionaceae bacterium]